MGAPGAPGHSWGLLRAKRFKIRRPLVGRVRATETSWGELTSLLPPSALGPLAARPWPQFVYSEAIHKLGPNFDPNGPNPATGGVGELWGKLSFKQIGSKG